MGYTGVHFAVKDAANGMSALVQIIVWVALITLTMLIAIPVVVIWATVKAVQFIRRRNAQQTQPSAVPRQLPSLQQQLPARSVSPDVVGDLVDAVQWLGDTDYADINLVNVRNFLGHNFCGVGGPPGEQVVTFTGAAESGVGYASAGEWIVESDEGLVSIPDAAFWSLFELADP